MKIKMPNLPEGMVSLALVGEQFCKIISSLEKLGIKVISVSVNDRLPNYENCHADMRAHHLGDEKIVIYKEDKQLKAKLEENGFYPLMAQSEFNGKYPFSVALNALRVGNILICKKENLDPVILQHAEENGIEIIDCRQGYSKCAACVISEKAVITSDISVYKALKEKLDVLLIGAGNIRLDETLDGMIGGAAFMIDSKTLAFCGDVTKHPDYIEIEKFLKKHEVSHLCLIKEVLLDVGSVIALETAQKSEKIFKKHLIFK